MSIAVGFQPATGQLTVAPQDTADPSSDEFNQTITVGALTVAGIAVPLDQTFDVTIGALTVAGIVFNDTIDNDAKQFVTVTDITKFGAEVTFYDVLSGVAPQVGDKWWVPTTSTDGGAFTLNGDGTFTIGTPTSGTDQILDVSFYDASLDQWHGPQDVSVQDFPNVLTVEPTTQPAFTGNAFLFLNGTFVNTIGALTIAGQDVRKGLLLPIDTAGALTVAGQTVDITSFVLSIDNPGALTVLGNFVLLDQSIDITNAGLTVSGREIVLFEGVNLTVDTGVLSLSGQDITRDSVYTALTVGALTIAGQVISVEFIAPPAPPVLFDVHHLTTASPAERRATSSPAGRYTTVSPLKRAG